MGIRRPTIRFAFLAMLASIPPFLAARADPPPIAEHTVLIYWNGKSEFYSDMAVAMDQMESVVSTDANVKVVVQFGWLDESAGGLVGIPQAKTRKSGAARFEIKPDPLKPYVTDVTSPIVKDLGDADMGDWRTLRDFIVWGTENYPAKRTTILMKNHGKKWTGSRGIAFGADRVTGNALEFHDLGMAMKSARKKTGVKIDVVVLDACNQGTLEAAGQLQGETRYLVGTMNIMSVSSMNYPKTVDELIRNPSMDVRDFAEKVARIELSTYGPLPRRAPTELGGGVVSDAFTNFTVYDVDRMPKFATSFRDLLDRLERLPDDRFAAFLTDLKVKWNPGDFSGYDTMDARPTSYLLAQAAEPYVGEGTAERLLADYEEMMVFDPGGRNGLGLWFPKDPSERALLRQYDDTTFGRFTGWAKFLDRAWSAIPFVDDPRRKACAELMKPGVLSSPKKEE